MTGHADRLIDSDSSHPGSLPSRGNAAPIEADARSGPRAGPEGAIASETLFAGAREVLISHQGNLYRLKQTALGKLILTK